MRQWCSTPVPEQGKLGACTAHAAAAIIEYFQNRAFGKHFTASRQFIYKNARNLQGVPGDQGSHIRDTRVIFLLTFAG
ncbi:hypothetical protein SPTER_49240 (plasmid) [Sporomusa termitida]|uniref:Peptidase C1A papain C-terminal domain-containing protein n=1 Tax=Sporomusa termitida TaxID=2377 RepID=A0A517E1G5_9FIRM|nr:hypothetical protein SPTER_49240 [Sporomusa termitida]